MSEKTRKSWLWPILIWCLGILGMIGIWLGVSVWLDRPCFWMTLIAVIDMTVILRFSGFGAGRIRFLGIFLGTLIIVLASQWLIAANAFGLVMGLLPLEAAKMVGPVLVWEFSRLRVVQSDWIWFLASILPAVWFGFRK